MELGDYGGFLFRNLTMMFRMFNSFMCSGLKKPGWRKSQDTLEFWKQNENAVSYVSSLSFTKFASASLCTQALFASAKRLFSDLGWIEGRACQSTHMSSVGMEEITHVYVYMRLKDISAPKSNLLHPQGIAFRHIASAMAQKVFEGPKEEYRSK